MLKQFNELAIEGGLLTSLLSYSCGPFQYFVSEEVQDVHNRLPLHSLHCSKDPLHCVICELAQSWHQREDIRVLWL